MHTCGTALLPNIPLRMARQRPTITSSLMFSMMPAASPAIRASRIGAAGSSQLMCAPRSSHCRTKLELCQTEAGCLLTFVEVPKEEEFAPTGCGRADVTKKIDAGVPEHAVEAQHHLQTGMNARETVTQPSNCCSSAELVTLHIRNRLSSSLGF